MTDRSGEKLAILLAVLALAPALAACAATAPAPVLPGPGAASLREQALALAQRDDDASLERADRLLEEAAGLEPGLGGARADRALVGFLAAAARRDEAARLADGDALARSARDLRERALDALRPLVRAHPRDPAVARALAVYYGLDGRVAEAAENAARARPSLGPDPWLDLAELAAALAGSLPEAALPPLAAFAASHPGLVRARVVQARLQVDAGQVDAALATLDEILAANPDHERARDLKASLLAPPPARVLVVPAPPDAPPPRAWSTLPRKPGR